MTDAYESGEFVHAGFAFTYELHYDNHGTCPWKEYDGHGPVSDWRDRDTKRPGERPLPNSGRDSTCRFYDFAEATRIAKREGWGLGDDELAKLRADLGREPTRKQIVKRAVENDYRYLARWCNDEWHYMGVVVRFDLTDIPSSVLGNVALVRDEIESLWGIESDCYEYIEETKVELADQLLAKLPDEVVMRARMELAA